MTMEVTFTIGSLCLILANPEGHSMSKVPSFSFVFFGGLVSYFFDIAYPGVHDCLSLCYYHGETRISWICFIVRT